MPLLTEIPTAIEGPLWIQLEAVSGIDFVVLEAQNGLQLSGRAGQQVLLDPATMDWAVGTQVLDVWQLDGAGVVDERSVTVQFGPVNDPGQDDVQDLVSPLFAVVAGSAMAVVLVTSVTPRGRRWWSLALFPLYSRISHQKVLQADRRTELLTMITEHPGLHRGELERRLQWNAGTLRYHLSVLIRNDFVRVKEEGNRKLYYTGDEDDVKPALRAREQSVIDLIEGVEAGRSLTELAEALELPASSLHYTLSRLVSRRILRKERRRYYVEAKEAIVQANGTIV